MRLENTSPILTPVLKPLLQHWARVAGVLIPHLLVKAETKWHWQIGEPGTGHRKTNKVAGCSGKCWATAASAHSVWCQGYIKLTFGTLTSRRDLIRLWLHELYHLKAGQAEERTGKRQKWGRERLAEEFANRIYAKGSPAGAD